MWNISAEPLMNLDIQYEVSYGFYQCKSVSHWFPVSFWVYKKRCDFPECIRIMIWKPEKFTRESVLEGSWSLDCLLVAHPRCSLTNYRSQQHSSWTRFTLALTSWLYFIYILVESLSVMTYIRSLYKISSIQVHYYGYKKKEKKQTLLNGGCWAP